MCCKADYCHTGETLKNTPWRIEPEDSFEGFILHENPGGEILCTGKGATA